MLVQSLQPMRLRKSQDGSLDSVVFCNTTIY